MEDDINNPSPSELKKIEKLLKDSEKLNPKIRKRHKDKTLKEKMHLNNAISTLLEEYVDCFILFAYDTNGSPIILINSKNNLESRALTDLLDEFITKAEGPDELDLTDFSDDDLDD